jgi:hypothetical protein
MSGLQPLEILIGQPWGFTTPVSKERSPGSPFRPMLVYAAPLALFYSATCGRDGSLALEKHRHTLFLIGQKRLRTGPLQR